jgi:hypothetical protein
MNFSNSSLIIRNTTSENIKTTRKIRMKILLLTFILANANIAFASESSCSQQSLFWQEGIYALTAVENSKNDVFDEFLQIAKTYTQDGGPLFDLLGIKFIDPSITSEKIKQMTVDQLTNSAEETQYYYSGNASVFSKTTLSNEVIICSTLVGWETNQISSYIAKSDGQLILKLKNSNALLHYQHISSVKSAVKLNSW